jgi:short-subunit dehydrogenase
MKLDGKTVLITGAASGIGRATAHELATRGARLLLLGRDESTLMAVAGELRESGAQAEPVVQDLDDLEALPGLWRNLQAGAAAPDVLVNNAGRISFSPIGQELTEDTERLFRVNVLAPMILCREAAETFRARGGGQIVNVGSIFGSIAFAYFATYSASKFALRGYTEALRRELSGSGVRVTYVAPRATRTRMADAFGRMAEAVGMKLDAPELVARRIVRAVERDADDRYLGFPESLFVRINALIPRFVDRALREQNRKTRPFAEAAAALRGAAS